MGFRGKVRRCWFLFLFAIAGIGLVPLESYALGSGESIESSYCNRIQGRLNGLKKWSRRANWKDSKYHCHLAESEWLSGIFLDDPSNFPIVVHRKSQGLAANRDELKILMLSPKWSSAYDETSITIMEQFSSRGLNVKYVLFNYLGDEQQAQTMLSNAEVNGVDLVFSVGSSATAFMTQSYSHGNIPVVTACSKDPVSIGQVDPAIGMSQNNIAYTSLNISVETQVSYLKEKFMTGLKRIAVIYDRNNKSSIITQVNPLVDYLASGEHGITVDLLEVDFESLESSLYQPMKQIVSETQNIGETIFLITGSTEIFNIIDYINYFAQQIPVLSVTPSHVRSGEKSVFVAIGVSFKTNAKLAAGYALAILEETAETSTLPVGIVSTPDIAINFLRKPVYELKVPFNFFEDSVFIYNYDGEPVRENGQMLSH